MIRTLITTMAILGMIGFPGLACADDDLTSLSYISYLERYVRLTSSQGQETMEAVVNMPVLVGDRLDTARGARAEVVLADGTTVWVDQYTTLDFDAVAHSRDHPSARTIVYLAEGGLVVEIPQQVLGDGMLRLDTPAGSLFLNRPGLYRLALQSGHLKVEAHSGLVELPAGLGSRLLRGGQMAWVTDGGIPDVHALAIARDDFWAWVEDRRRPAPQPRSAGHVQAPDRQVRVLDTYGEWVYVNTFSTYMWRPRVALTWAPYSYGRWVWTPVGWTWVAYEPWGWLPYHYGSWYWDVQLGWLWHWNRVWGPAWVHWIYTPGYVGWVPRGYYDWWYWRHYRHGGRAYYPSRWSHSTLDFRGRVRLRDIDLRHWTVVPTDHFTAGRLDRVRVDGTRLARDLPADRELYVRSGPLVSRDPIRTNPERQLSALLRDRDTGRGGGDSGDLAPMLRREVRTGADRSARPSGIRETDIGQVGREVRERTAGEASGDRSAVRTGSERRVGATDRTGTGRPVGDRAPVTRQAPADRGSNAPRAPAVRPETQRPAPASRGDRAPEASRPAPRSESTPARTAPRTESPPARSEPAARQPSPPTTTRSQPAPRQPSSPPPSTGNAPASPSRRDTSARPSLIQQPVPRSADPAERGFALPQVNRPRPSSAPAAAPRNPMSGTSISRTAPAPARSASTASPARSASTSPPSVSSSARSAPSASAARSVSPPSSSSPSARTSSNRGSDRPR